MISESVIKKLFDGDPGLLPCAMENMFQSHNSTFVIVLDVFVFDCDAHPLLDLDGGTDRQIGAKRPKLAQNDRNRLVVLP